MADPAIMFQENQVHQPPRVLFLEWDPMGSQWIYDTWNSGNPDNPLVLLDGDQVPTTVHHLLGSPNLKITGHRGLVCLQHNHTTHILFEPSTHSLRSLPRLNTVGIIMRTCFMGFARRRGSYFNVLSVSIDTNGHVHHKLLNIGNNPVNNTRWISLYYGLDIPHFPDEYSTSVCINEMIYYSGHTTYAPAVIKFDIRQQDFTLIHLPAPFLDHFERSTAVGIEDMIWNEAVMFAFRGNLAVAIAVGFSLIERIIWTFDPITSTWSELVVPLNPVTQGLENSTIYMVELEGTAHCQRKLVFTLRRIFDLSIDYIVYYDVVGAAPIERFEVDIIPTEDTKYVWDHTDSIWLG